MMDIILDVEEKTGDIYYFTGGKVSVMGIFEKNKNLRFYKFFNF